MAMPLAEISNRTGYSISRISILRSDPTFAELVQVYQKRIEEVRDEALADGFARLEALRNDAIEEMQDRLNENPELLSADTLMDLIKMTSDRTGLAPVSKSVNLNASADLAGRIAAGRARVLSLSAPKGGGGEAVASPLPLPGRAGDE